MHRTGDLTLHISSGCLRRILLWIVAGLAAASFLAQLLRYMLEPPAGLVQLFDADSEGNVPTFYSSVALLACAALLALRATGARQAAERYARHWIVLAMLFFAAALDESVRLHERVNKRLASAAGVDDEALLWVAPAAALVLVVLVAYRKFFRALPEPVRRRASHGAAIFVAGALGVELLEWATVASLGGETEQLVDGLVSTVQEFLEMLGVVFILEALVLLLSVDGESIRLRVG